MDSPLSQVSARALSAGHISSGLADAGLQSRNRFIGWIDNETDVQFDWLSSSSTHVCCVFLVFYDKFTRNLCYRSP